MNIEWTGPIYFDDHNHRDWNNKYYCFVDGVEVARLRRGLTAWLCSFFSKYTEMYQVAEVHADPEFAQERVEKILLDSQYAVEKHVLNQILNQMDIFGVDV